MPFDVFGIENPLIDLLARVPEGFLEQLELEKNRMYLVDTERHRALLTALDGVEISARPAGSCANTLIGIAQLGGTAAYCGKVGADDYGRVYIDKLEEEGVTSYISASGSLTGSTVILVTPDAARTMNTYLGACQELTADDVPVAALRDSRLLYITGYLWDTDGQQAAARLALRTAKEAGLTVAMSLADPFCVARHKDDFIALLQEHTDLVFANEEEALALTGADNAQEAMAQLGAWCPEAVVTLGARGSIVRGDDETVYVDPFPTEAVDSTGAGDAYAAGYLHARRSGASLHQRGRVGNFFASQVIRQVGARLEGDVKGLMAPVLDDPRP